MKKQYTRGILLMSCLLAAPAHASHREFGDIELLTSIPASPGFPEGIAVRGGRAITVGAAAFGTAGGPPSALHVIRTANGTIRRTLELEGEDLSLEHASSAVALDRRGRIYALNTQLGVVRLDRRGRNQEQYAGLLPDLPPCAPEVEEPCSATTIDRPPFPNDMVFDSEGNLFISDSFQASIFRVPPGGGEPELWLSDPSMDGEFGVNGIRFSPDRSQLYFANTDPVVGGMYAISLDTPEPQIELVHAYPGGGPDGFAFGEDGHMYVALAFANQVSVLDPDGNEIALFGGAPTDPENPFSNPSGIAFNGRGSILVTNHAIFDPNPTEQFAVFDIFVDDRGDCLERPLLP